jgi:hypothetical protein
MIMNISRGIELVDVAEQAGRAYLNTLDIFSSKYKLLLDK